MPESSSSGRLVWIIEDGKGRMLAAGPSGPDKALRMAQPLGRRGGDRLEPLHFDIDWLAGCPGAYPGVRGP